MAYNYNTNVSDSDIHGYNIKYQRKIPQAIKRKGHSNENPINNWSSQLFAAVDKYEIIKSREKVNFPHNAEIPSLWLFGTMASVGLWSVTTGKQETMEEETVFSMIREWIKTDKKTGSDTLL